MKIFIIGAGHMGSWLTEELCHDHDVAVFDTDPRKLKYFINVQRYMSIDEVRDFKPEMVLNCVSLQKTEEVFNQLLPLIPEDCILSDIASVKNGLYDYLFSLRSLSIICCGVSMIIPFLAISTISSFEFCFSWRVVCLAAISATILSTFC